MNNTITLQNISKRYLSTEGKFALQNINLEIEEGEFFCLVGPSGCGKTTLLKLIIGLEEPNSGRIEKPSDVSMVFQSAALLPWLTVEDNIALGLKAKGLSDNQAKDLSSKFISMVNLNHFTKKYPRELSGGQRQRVGIARALAVIPKVLLLDEPFSSLDPITTRELHKDLLKIWQETKITIVMVSHSIEEAVELADRIGVMTQGHLQGIIQVGMGRPRQIKSVEFLKEADKITSLLA